MLPPLGAIAALLLLLPAGSATAESRVGTPPPDGWEFEDRDERAGWVLYTQAVPGSNYPRYRLVGHTDQPIEHVIAALHLKARDDRYLPKGHQRRVLERGDDFFISHMRIDAPVIADRDAVLHLSWRTDEQTGVHRLDWRMPTENVPPVAKGAVRVVSRGSWVASPLAGGGTEVVYQQHSEIGDSVPGWLINRLMNGQIVNELLTLQRILDDGLADVAASPTRAD